MKLTLIAKCKAAHLREQLELLQADQTRALDAHDRHLVLLDETRSRLRFVAGLLVHQTDQSLQRSTQFDKIVCSAQQR